MRARSNLPRRAVMNVCVRPPPLDELGLFKDELSIEPAGWLVGGVACAGLEVCSGTFSMTISLIMIGMCV